MLHFTEDMQITFYCNPPIVGCITCNVCLGKKKYTDEAPDCRRNVATALSSINKSIAEKRLMNENLHYLDNEFSKFSLLFLSITRSEQIMRLSYSVFI